MQWILPLAQAAPQWAEFAKPAPAEPNWALLVFVLIGSLGIQVLFGWWAVTRAEEHDSNKIAAFVAGFFFLYMGVRMTPILRYDRIFNTPRAPRPLPPRITPPLPAGFQSPQPPQPAGVQVVSPTAQPPAAPDVCRACGAPRREGRKTCMSCGAAMPAGS